MTSRPPIGRLAPSPEPLPTNKQQPDPRGTVTQLNGYAAHFNADTSGVLIERLDIGDRDVCREAQRWTTGERGPIVDDPDLLAAADLTNYYGLRESVPLLHRPTRLLPNTLEGCRRRG